MSAAPAATEEPEIVFSKSDLTAYLYPETLLAALFRQRRRDERAYLEPFEIAAYYRAGSLLGIKIEVLDLDETPDPRKWNFMGRIVDLFPGAGHFEWGGLAEPDEIIDHGIPEDHPFRVDQFVNGQIVVSYTMNGAGQPVFTCWLGIAKYTEGYVQSFQLQRELQAALGSAH